MSVTVDVYKKSADKRPWSVLDGGVMEHAV